MFAHRDNSSTLSRMATTCELIFHSMVRSVRSKNSNALMAILVNIMQMVVFVAVFYIMFSVLNLRRSAVRGDFLLYMMSGIFLFMCHVKAVGAIASADSASSPMMQHAPMNPFIAVASAALSALYLQVLSMLVILVLYHIAMTPITIYDPIPAIGMVLLAWFTGCGVGLIFYSIKPWFPGFVSIASTVYQRANMIASGKMFLANTLPGFMLPIFDWNPLFHTIDQARGFVFINYNPHFSNWKYALWVGVALLMIGLMGEFYTRRNASISWGARR
ncbi:ABC transporter permease [Albibacillus kandeliae]|uniref:ABC transporter permease n=1 Tax=Albibacillus kandeliae TaxID=2174228 RepID=UPI000D6A01F2|nr:ABC transporter permease [Albibacillus kandeliae]